MRIFSVSALLLIFPIIHVLAQQKPPVVYDDSLHIAIGTKQSVNVLANDVCMEGHSMRIFHVSQINCGTVTFDDSTIIVNMDQYYSTIQTVICNYDVIDLDNGLTSEEGKLFIHIHRLEWDEMPIDTLSINNITAGFYPVGNFFWDEYNSLRSVYSASPDMKKYTLYLNSLWIGAILNDELHTRFSGWYRYPYHTTAPTFFIGPKTEILHHSIDYLEQWNRTWELTKQEIEYHKNHWNDPGYSPPENISEWPAHGAEDLGQASHLAPFFDQNSNGYYDPMKGDYPVVYGDECIFSLYSDWHAGNMPYVEECLGFEIQKWAYAYNCPNDSALQNTIFLHYDLINRSNYTYDNLYAGSFTLFCIGQSVDHNDMYTGCDTVLNSYYGYNDPYDESHGYYPFYEEHPPAQGICFLNPKMKTFMGYELNEYFTNYPFFIDLQKYYHMQGLWNDTTPFTYGGNGIGGTIPVKRLYPGNPSNPNEWSEVSAGFEPGQRMGIGSTGPHFISPNDTLSLDLALVFALDYQGTNLSSVDLLKERIEQIRYYFENDTIPCQPAIGITENHHKKGNLIIYPNPASEKIHIKGYSNKPESEYRIFDITGRMVLNGNIYKPVIEIGALKPGLYFLQIYNDSFSGNYRFVKK